MVCDREFMCSTSADNASFQSVCVNLLHRCVKKNLFLSVFSMTRYYSLFNLRHFDGYFTVYHHDFNKHFIRLNS